MWTYLSEQKKLDRILNLLGSVKYKYDKEKNDYSKTGRELVILLSPAYIPRLKYKTDFSRDKSKSYLACLLGEIQIL